jgi:hypothetical protein
MMSRWIEQGMPRGSEKDPVVAKIQCLPAGRVMDRNAQQQISVMATYSDGSSEDVTRMALYEPNDNEMAESSVTGLVKTLGLAGDGDHGRYQGRVSTFRATFLGPRKRRAAAEEPRRRGGVQQAEGARHSPRRSPTIFPFLRVGVITGLPGAGGEFLADKGPAKR